jgi:hypothetical protein
MIEPMIKMTNNPIGANIPTPAKVVPIFAIRLSSDADNPMPTKRIVKRDANKNITPILNIFTELQLKSWGQNDGHRDGHPEGHCEAHRDGRSSSTKSLLDITPLSKS